MNNEHSLDVISNSILYDESGNHEPSSLRMFGYHIYEYRKGLRSLVLHTSPKVLRNQIESRLAKENIEYVIYSAGNNINSFFGDPEFVDVVKQIGKSDLREYSLEEDFILGTLLGYSRKEQCRRYLSRLLDS